VICRFSQSGAQVASHVRASPGHHASQDRARGGPSENVAFGPKHLVERRAAVALVVIGSSERLLLTEAEPVTSFMAMRSARQPVATGRNRLWRSTQKQQWPPPPAHREVATLDCGSGENGRFTAGQEPAGPSSTLALLSRTDYK